MTTKQAIRSLIAYLNHFGPQHKCKEKHENCAIRRNGVCVDKLIKEFPEYANMKIGELKSCLNILR